MSLALVMIFFTPIYGEEDTQFLTSLAHNLVINIGLSAVNNGLTVSDSTLGGEGELVHERGFVPSISLGFKNAYFGESNWGYSVAIGWAQFEMNEQKIGDTITNLGTSADGSLWFVVPTAFYMFGAKHYEGWYFRPGLGFGVGYLQTQGNIILTSAPSQPTTSFNIRSDPISVSYNVFLEAGYKNWFLKTSISGPMNQEKNRQFNGNRTAVTIGYSWILFP